MAAETAGAGRDEAARAREEATEAILDRGRGGMAGENGRGEKRKRDWEKGLMGSE